MNCFLNLVYTKVNKYSIIFFQAIQLEYSKLTLTSGQNFLVNHGRYSYGETPRLGGYNGCIIPGDASSDGIFYRGWLISRCGRPHEEGTMLEFTLSIRWWRAGYSWIGTLGWITLQLLLFKAGWHGSLHLIQLTGRVADLTVFQFIFHLLHVSSKLGKSLPLTSHLNTLCFRRHGRTWRWNFFGWIIKVGWYLLGCGVHDGGCDGDCWRFDTSYYPRCGLIPLTKTLALYRQFHETSLDTSVDDVYMWNLPWHSLSRVTTLFQWQVY